MTSAATSHVLHDDESEKRQFPWINGLDYLDPNQRTITKKILPLFPWNNSRYFFTFMQQTFKNWRTRPCETCKCIAKCIYCLRSIADTGNCRGCLGTVERYQRDSYKTMSSTELFDTTSHAVCDGWDADNSIQYKPGFQGCIEPAESVCCACGYAMCVSCKETSIVDVLHEEQKKEGDERFAEPFSDDVLHRMCMITGIGYIFEAPPYTEAEHEKNELYKTSYPYPL